MNDSVKTKIRSLKESDIKEVLQIQDECGLSVWTAKDYLNEMLREDALSLVVETSDNKIIGFAIVRLLLGENDFSSEILNIAVKNSFQTKGIGQKLFDEIIRRLKEKNVLDIWLEVRKSNEKAINFYQKNGFMKQFERKNYYQHPLEDACIFKLLLDYET